MLPRSQTLSTRLIFLLVGFAMGAWAPLVPFAKSRASLNEAQLGTLLLCIGLGSLLTMPVTGPLTGKVGCRPVILVASAVIAATFPLLAILSTKTAMAMALFAFGAGVGTTDVAMNVQALLVEKAAGKPLMSSFHGMYSVGGILGACSISALLGLGLAPATAALAGAAVLLVLLAAAAPCLLPYGDEHSGPIFAIPRGSVLAIGALCFIAFLAEGAVLDWSAVFLTTTKAVQETKSGWAYAAFAVTMSLGRLNGDRLTARFGSARVFLFGAGWAALALAAAALAPAAWLSIAAFAVMGFGLANLAPILFRLAGAQSSMPAGLAIATITTLGYAGILAGPAAIGQIAHTLSLTTGLLGLSATIAFAALLGYRLASRSKL